MSLQRRAIRVVAMMECSWVTGPAKNLIEFARRARRPDSEFGTAEISVVTFHRGPLDQPATFVTAALEAGIPVDVIPERHRFDPGVLSKVRAAVERRQPDIVQSHNSKSHVLARTLGLWRSRPWLAFHHGDTNTDFKDRIYSKAGAWALRRADQVVTVCNAFSLGLQRSGIAPGRLAVQHNSVQPFVQPTTAEVQELRIRLGLRPGVKTVLTVGRLSREKGHIDLVHAMGLLKQRYSEAPFCLIVVGDGPERSAIERGAQAAGIADRVIMAGHQTNVAPYYCMADVLVLPSHSEGSPNVLLEAMAAGLPIVATSVGGVPDIATHRQNALLVAKSDTEAMAQAIAELFRDSFLAARLGCAAREVVTRHTPEAYCRSMLGLYHRLVDSRTVMRRPVSASR